MIDFGFWILDFGLGTAWGHGLKLEARRGAELERRLRPSPGVQSKIENRKSKMRRAFTLIELMVVITIILLISAIALPTVLPALAHRQVSEAARIVQGTLAGARDSAIHNNAPSGIRLLPDSAFPIQYVQLTLPNGNQQTQIDPTQPLVASRIIPLESAPEYSEGMVSTAVLPPNFVPPYPCLIVAETVVYTDPTSGNAFPNAPTSWFWNIRVGDKIQINNAGPWYTIVGPMVIPPSGAMINGVFYGNTEMFVNVGPPGSPSNLNVVQAGKAVTPEFLFLVNGIDDNGNGWIDEGWDGVDNNADGIIDNPGSPDQTSPIYSLLSEWEIETWQGTIAATNFFSNQQYTIQRRPCPSTNSREVALPTNVVIDLTTWGYPAATQQNPNVLPTLERSRLPVNVFTGYVDIVVYPNGTIVPTTIYSTPSSFGMSGAFFHIWLGERSDVKAPLPVGTQGTPPYLPIGNVPQQLSQGAPPNNPAGQLQGEYRLISLFSRTGQITTADNVPFDNPNNPANGVGYNPNYPFLAAQQGIRNGP
jgi:prepilin-type N-terminal cleavage/methylation domain-containing protein